MEKILRRSAQKLGVVIATIHKNVNVGEMVKDVDSLSKLFKILQEKLGHVGRQAMRPTCVLRLKVYSRILQVSKYILID